jgi:hypothetical protein
MLGIADRPGVATGFAGLRAFLWSELVGCGPGTGSRELGKRRSGRGGQFPQPGEDLQEQAMCGWQPQDGGGRGGPVTTARPASTACRCPGVICRGRP